MEIFNIIKMVGIPSAHKTYVKHYRYGFS